MRRYCRIFAVLCAFSLFLTACDGAGPEMSDGFLSLPDKQTVSDEPDAQPAPNESDASDGQDMQPAPDGQDAPPVSDEPGASDGQDAQPTPDESDAPPVSDEAEALDGQDAQPAPDVSDAPPVSDREDAQPAPDASDGQDAQLSGELFQEAEAVGEGASVGKLTEVYLPESRRYVPFLVLSADYGGNALLLRRHVLPERRPFNDYSAAYENSAIDRFLNGEYLQQLDAVGTLIVPSEIVVTDADALGVSGNEVKTLSRKVFPLSCAETGFTKIYDAGKEGDALPYFSDASRRIAYREDGAAASWWLRTPDAYYLSAAYGVGPDGSLGSGNAYNQNGVRPALCVPSDAQAFPTADIVDGQTVYFLRS